MIVLLQLLLLSGSPAAAPKRGPPAPSVAIFAGGCFWCMQPPFDAAAGVLRTRVGYTGGTLENPAYEQVSAGGTGHREAIEVGFDPGKTSYRELLGIFWKQVDPFDEKGQFCDKGLQYGSAIFYLDDRQKQAAELSKRELQESLGKAPVTPILKAQKFYPAEEYHQDYARKNPVKYKFYRYGCGRDRRLEELRKLWKTK